MRVTRSSSVFPKAVCWRVFWLQTTPSASGPSSWPEQPRRSGTNIPTGRSTHFGTKRTQFEGWDKWNREYWFANYPDFAEHFIRNIFSEPHSTKQIEDGIEWASGTSGEVLVNTVDGRSNTTLDLSETMYRKIGCPVLMIHGDEDHITPYARAQLVAEVTGAELVTIPGWRA